VFTLNEENGYRISLYKKTNDDWSPSYGLNTENVFLEDRLVEVRLLRLFKNYKTMESYGYKVSVWGGDDIGMEKEFVIENASKLREKELEAYYRGAAEQLFITLLNIEFVDQAWLRSIGFGPA
jgi:hypothetical protein